MENINRVPDAAELERLANKFFKETPGDHIKNEAQKQPGNNSSLFSDESIRGGSRYATPHAANTVLLDGQTDRPLEKKNLGTPFAANDSYDFNLSNPQTSHFDPHFENGEIPDTSGSGKRLKDESSFASDNLSSQLSGVYQNYPSFTDFGVYDPGLANASEQIKTIPDQPNRLPIDGVPLTSFYFLAQHSPYPRGDASPNVRQKGGDAFDSLPYTSPAFDVRLVKKDFPILNQHINGKPLIWLDNAATTQKPKTVIDRLSKFYEFENSNIHRAAHELAARATDAYEASREKIRNFINARTVNEIVFVRGTTEGINLIAQSWGAQNLKEGDEIIITHLEHHANIVPWQLLAKKKGLVIKVVPVDDTGQVILEEYRKLLNPRTKLVSFTHVSNALGTVTPAKTIIEMAHAQGAKAILDGAQSISHMRIDLQHLDPDFFVFSGHKVFGPTGIGVVYGKEHILNETQPWQGGGNMIKDVTFEHTEYHDAPARFEAGTGNIADAVGLGAAIDYINKIGIDRIAQYEHGLLEYGTALLKQIPGLKLVGTAKEKASVLSFVINGYENNEIGQILNKEGIAVRTGHHCAQPILRRFGLESSIRPSLAFYNSHEELDKLASVLRQVVTQRRHR